MYAADFVIKRLNEQIQLAPSLTEGTEPGGSVDQMCDKLKEQLGQANKIQQLRSVESGARRYTAKISAALEEIQKLKPLFEEITLIQSVPYKDEASKSEAMGRLKNHPNRITACCKTAIGHLEGAIKVLDEGERKDEKESRLVGAK